MSTNVITTDINWKLRRDDDERLSHPAFRRLERKRLRPDCLTARIDPMQARVLHRDCV